MEVESPTFDVVKGNEFNKSDEENLYNKLQ